MKIVPFLLFLVLAGCASHSPPPGRERFSDITEAAPGVIVEARYAGPDNFVGTPIDGYDAAKCLLVREAAEALAGVQRELETSGLRLRIYDCYRPQQAVDHFVRWAQDEDDTRMKETYYPDVPKAELFARGYIAGRSGHSRGATVDLTIDGLDMGGHWDFFDPLSHTMNADISPAARANRLLLKDAMEKAGFRNYDKEWWHYTLKNEPYPDVYFNFEIK